MPNRRKVGREEVPKRFSRFRQPVLHIAVTHLHEREGDTAVGQNENIVLQEDVRDIQCGFLVEHLRVVAADHIHNAENLTGLHSLRERCHAAETLVDILDREADLGIHLVRRNVDRNTLSVFKALDGALHNALREFSGLPDVRMVVIVLKTLRTGQTRRLGSRNDGRLEALCDFHDGREHVLDIRNPEIQRAGSEHQLRGDRIAERNHTGVAVHRRESGAANAVEAYALCARLLCELNERFLLADLDNLTDQGGQMAVHRDVHIPLLKGADVHLRGHAVADTEEAVGRNRGRDDTREGKGKAAAQELLHDTSPVAVRADAALMVSLKDLMVGADRNDVQILPDLLALRRGAGLDDLVVVRNGSGHIREQLVREFGGNALNASSLGLDAEGLCRVANLLLAENRKIEFPFRGPLERQNDLSAVHAVLRGTGRRRAKQVSRDNQIRIRAADALRALRRDLTWSHVADFAADAGETEATLRLLLVKAVKGRVKAELFRAEQHLPHGRVRRVVDDILLRGEGFLILGDRVHVVADKLVLVLLILMIRLHDHRRHTVLVKADDVSVAVDVRGTLVIVHMTVCMAMRVIVCMRMGMLVCMRVLVAVRMFLRCLVTVLFSVLSAHPVLTSKGKALKP